MTDNLAPPSGNNANLLDPSGILRLVLNKFLQATDNQLPAEIISYNRSTNIAKVQPLIVMVTTDNIQVQRAQIAAVPVQMPGGGGFFVSWPIKPGDIGWLEASDRDISLFKQFHKSAPPNTQRKHSFEDAVFIPDVMNQGVTIAEEDAENMVIQSLDGSVKITLSSDSINIVAPSAVNITSPMVKITAADEVTIDTPLTIITGELRSGTDPDYTRTATFGGNIQTTEDVIADTISLKTHIHGGVQTGGGDTGGPI